jgi:choline dehydrogenase
MEASLTDEPLIGPAPVNEQGLLAARVLANQHHLTTHLRKSYDFIVCGSGSSGSVVARRLAENSAVTVLLIEAGGSDEVPNVSFAGQWPTNLGSERDWAFRAETNSRLNGRAIPLNAGKVLGGGSSINVMIWSRGHANDWTFFAEQAGDPGWNYESALNLYRRIEDWQGPADPSRRGSGGPVFVQPAPDPNPIAAALLESARAAAIPTFDSPNGRMMESHGGCSLIDMRIRNGQRLSVFRSYSYPYMDRPNFTVLTGALVTKIIFEGQRAVGVEVGYQGQIHRFGAELELVLSMGAIQTPKVLMQS